MSFITAVRTIRITERPNLIWVEVDTDEGLTGLGETFRGTEAVEGAVHGLLAEALIGADSRAIEMHSRRNLSPYVGYHSSGAEVRGAAAIDIALWDLVGKRHGIPVHEALGGRARDTVAAYNTCAGYSYNSGNTGGFNRVLGGDDVAVGPYDDQIAFGKNAGALAESLLSEGYKAMKIWPFDIYAKSSGGQSITLSDLKKGLEPFKRIRQAVGDEIEIMCEMHSMWSPLAAERICRAMEDHKVYWAEDPICKMDDATALADLRSKTSVAICGSETLGGAVPFRQMFEVGALDIAMVDVGWCGGLTEARKIAALAEAYNKPLAPHDCTGPVSLWAGLHLALHAPTAIYQEMVRAAMSTWYRELVTELPNLEQGMFTAPTGPGLGCELAPGVHDRTDAVVRETRA